MVLQRGANEEGVGVNESGQCPSPLISLRVPSFTPSDILSPSFELLECRSQTSLQEVNCLGVKSSTNKGDQ